jgi:hypothetical protein
VYSPSAGGMKKKTFILLIDLPHEHSLKFLSLFRIPAFAKILHRDEWNLIRVSQLGKFLSG